MSEDTLLHELGRLAQEENEAEEARRDERWERLAAGTLSAEEDQALRALAATSPAAREAYEAFRPLGAEFQARVVGAIESELQRPAPTVEISEPGEPVEPPEPRFRLLPFRPVTLRFAGWLATAAVAASGLLLVLRGPGTMPPLPLYAAQLSGGIQTFRGGPGPVSGPQRFAPGSKLSLVVRPEHPVGGEVEARAFLARGAAGAEIVPWEPAPRFEVSPQGVVRLQGTIGEELPLPPGASRVWIVVGRRGNIPAAGELVSALRAGRTRSRQWQAVSAELRVVDQPPP